jgi:hypothetical protein
MKLVVQRQPTSHERRAGQSWDASYVDGPAPWDISDAGGEALGPHPVSQEELRAASTPGSGWRIASIRPDRTESRFDPQGSPAWLVEVERP